MMILSPRRQNKRSRLLPALGTLALLGVILSFLPMPSFLSRITHSIAVPFLRAETALGGALSPLTTYLHTKKYLSDEIRRLEAERESLIRAGLMNAYLLDENRQMRAALNRNTEIDRGTVASVLAGPARTPYDTLIIDAGKNENVVLGGLAVSPSGYALGTVTSVFDRSAVVTLFSSSQHATRVTIGTSSLHSLKAVGNGGGTFEIQVPREIIVEEGSVVLLPGSPPYPLGAVEKIIAKETSAYQSVLFAHPINIFSVRTVIIMHAPQVPHAWKEDPVSGGEEETP